MTKIKLCCWSKCSDARKQGTAENIFLARYQSAGFFSRLAIRMLLTIAQLRMGHSR